jgi:hypothetical protein
VGALSCCTAALKDAKTRVVNGVGGAQMPLESSFIKCAHPASCGLIFNGPETHDDGPRAGDLKGTSQAEHAFARANLAQAGVARREHHPFGSLQVQPRHFFSGQDAIPLSSAGIDAPVRAGKRES